MILHVLHREVGGLEEVRALPEAGALLEALAERHAVDAVDGPDSRDRLERRLELAAQLDAVLLAQRVSEVRRSDSAALDQDLAEAAPGLVLGDERLGELRLRDASLLDEQAAERAPRRGNDSEVRCRLRLGGLLQFDAVLG